MGTTELIHQVQIWIAFGDYPRSSFILKCTMSRNICRCITKCRQFPSLLIFMVTVNLIILSFTETQRKRISEMIFCKIQEFSLIFAVRKWNKFHFCNRHSRSVRTRKTLQGLCFLKCSQKHMYTLLRIPFMGGGETKEVLSINILLKCWEK